MCCYVQENLSEIDAGSSLGLSQESVLSYRVGDQLRTVGSKLNKGCSTLTQRNLVKSCV